MTPTLNVSIRYLIAWVVVCLLPLPLMYLAFGVDVTRDEAAINTTIASTASILVGLHISRQLFAFPGTRQRTQGISAVFVGFAIVAGLLLFLRIQYSATLLAYSLLATALLMSISPALLSKKARNHFYLVPFGETASLFDLPGVSLTVMHDPELPTSGDASIVADLRAELPSAWERLLAAASLKGIPVYHFKHLHESIAGKVKIEHPSENTLGSLVPNQTYKELKWAADRVFAAILVPLLLPFLLVVAVIIKLQDGGPVFYRQQRVGQGGKPFLIYKFRSMSVPDKNTPGSFTRESAITADRDTRITPFGSFIRKYRIDEIPQIINILRGEMSFIGPRPEAIPLAEWYNSEIPFYAYRHIVRPGLTGWAQVNQGHVADLSSIDFKLQYDFFYVKYFSPWLDALIVLRTIRTVLTGFGSK